MSLNAATEGVTHALEALKQTIAESAAPVTMPEAVAGIKAEITTLLTAGERMDAALTEAVDRLKPLSERLKGDLLATLHQRIEEERTAAANALDKAREDFEDLATELKGEVTAKMEDWFSDAIGTLGDELEGAIDDVEQAAKNGARQLADNVTDSITRLGDDIIVQVAERAQAAGRDVIDAAVERAITEVADTIFTAQMGAMITTTIGPYLPAVIAIKPALPAIQDALDIMRGGF